MRQRFEELFRLIETGAAVARQLARVLDERDLRAGGGNAKERFWTSGDPARRLRRANRDYL